MSTVSVIVVIVGLLGALVCYAFAIQTIQQKRERRQRLLTALKTRARTFKFLLNGFPPGFLTKELTNLVQRSLADVCEQLSSLEPNEPSHLQDLQLISSQMVEAKRNVKPTAATVLENHQQIKDVKVGLEELYKFIERLQAKRSLPKTTTDLYRAQVKHLVLLVTVDSYCLHGRQAKQANKTKLAIHYYDLAYRLLLRENKPTTYQQKIQKTRAILDELQEQLAQEEPHKPLTDQELADREEVEGEWDKFSEKDDVWKKKNIYD